MLRLQHAWRSILAGRLPLLFLLVTLVPAGALVVLGLRLASQDRVLLGQRIAELRQADLDGAVRALSAEVQSWQGALAARDFRGAASLPSDSALILVSTREARALPPGRMLWSPLPPRLAEAPDTAFREAGQLEFAGGREEEALRAYESLAQSPDAAVRAGGADPAGECPPPCRPVEGGAGCLRAPGRLFGSIVQRHAGGPFGTPRAVRSLSEERTARRVRPGGFPAPA